MSLVERVKKWRHYRLRLADGWDLAREIRHMLRWRRHRLSPADQKELEGALAEWFAAARQADDAMVTARDRLELLLTGKFAFLRRAAWLQQAEGIAVMVFLALFLRAFVVEAFQIPSSSMVPTLQVGDRIFVNKFVYGVRVPFTLVKFLARNPSRGDIIVFNSPEHPDVDLIKRVVAIEGDEIEMRDSILYVNGVAVARHPVDGQCHYWDYDERQSKWLERACDAYKMRFDDERQFVTLQDPEHPGYSSFAPRKVPARSVFCLGDNRDNSRDSRYWGYAPIEYIKGRAMFIWYSQGEPTARVRTERLFSTVR